MTNFIYNLTWKLAKPLVKFYFYKRGKKDPQYSLHLEERFKGTYSNSSFSSQKKCIHVHAASLGEVNLIKTFIIKIVETIDCNVVLTTNTPTGRASAQKLADQINTEETRLLVVYAPLEYKKAILNFIDYFNPSYSYFVETEIWPNFIKYLSQHHKISLVNARLTESSYNKFSTNIFRNSLLRMDKIVCQSLESAFLYSGILEKKSWKELQANLKASKVPFEITQVNNYQEVVLFSSKIKTKIYIGKNLKFNKDFSSLSSIYIQEIINSIRENNYYQSLYIVDNNGNDLSINSNVKDSDTNLFGKEALLLSSTYPDELELIMPSFTKFKEDFFFLVAPRHKENFNIIADKISDNKLSLVYFSSIREEVLNLIQELEDIIKKSQSFTQFTDSIEYNQDHKNDFFAKLSIALTSFYKEKAYSKVIEILHNIFTLMGADKANVLLIDTVGDLSKLYPLVNISLIGGTFNKVHGHDYIESVAHRLPIISGYNFLKQRSVVEDLVLRKAINLVTIPKGTKDFDLERVANISLDNLLNEFNSETKQLREFFINTTNKEANSNPYFTFLANLDSSINKFAFKETAMNGFVFYKEQAVALTNHLEILGFVNEQENSNISR